MPKLTKCSPALLIQYLQDTKGMEKKNEACLEIRNNRDIKRPLVQYSLFLLWNYLTEIGCESLNCKVESQDL